MAKQRSNQQSLRQECLEMASNNTEIEIKIPITKEEFLKLKEQLKNNSNKTKEQKDTYYTPKHKNFLAQKYPYEWLRIREQGSKSILNYKHYYPEGAERNTHCDEYETEIDAKQAEMMLKALDFKELITVDKIRETYDYKGFEIALDEVKELGFFVEIEAINNLETVEKTREELYKIARELKINITNEDLRGYPYLMLEKKGLMPKA